MIPKQLCLVNAGQTWTKQLVNPHLENMGKEHAQRPILKLLQLKLDMSLICLRAAKQRLPRISNMMTSIGKNLMKTIGMTLLKKHKIKSKVVHGAINLLFHGKLGCIGTSLLVDPEREQWVAQG